jgi:hypothetical protein
MVSSSLSGTENKKDNLIESCQRTKEGKWIKLSK